MDDKQIEALRAEVEEAKLSIEALMAKNRELIMSNKKLKNQTSEIDPDKYNAMQDELETLKHEHDKLNKLYKTDTERLSKGLNEKESYLQRLLVDDGLTNALAKLGITGVKLFDAKAILKDKIDLKQNGDKYEALIGDKPLNDFIKEWVEAKPSDDGFVSIASFNIPSGKNYIAAPQNTGGGATGGGSSGGQKSFKDMSEMERNTLYRENPQLFQQMAKGS